MKIGKYLIKFVLPIFGVLLVGCSATSEATQPKATLTANEGAVRVVLFYSEEAGRPLRNQSIFLAEMIPFQGGELEGAFVPALDLVTAPKGLTNDNGEVIISLIPPGKYALTVLTPTGPLLLMKQEDEKEIVVDIRANELIDLGEIIVLMEPSVTED